MNEFGVDCAFERVIPDSALSSIYFGIFRIGTFGYGGTGTAAYYTKGLQIQDTGFIPNMAKLRAAGKPAGVYIFSYAFDVRSAEAEAVAVCDFLQQHSISPDLPIFWDWEDDSYNRVSAAGIQITGETLQAMAYAFCNICRSRGYRAGLYTFRSFATQFWGREWITSFRAAGNFFWVAEFADSTPLADISDCWQYAGDQLWNGIIVDYNRALTDRFFQGGGGGSDLLKSPAFLAQFSKKRAQPRNGGYRKI